jgi:prepilin-type N-terminal cleavage/methylation domain-containing protein
LAAYSSSSESGFSLVEVMMAAALLGAALISLGQLFAMSTQSNLSARSTTYAAVLAEQKLEELRGLTWGFDAQGLPVTDTSTNTAVSPETALGGTGLTPSPPTALQENTPGYVDYVSMTGAKVGDGGETAPGDAVYTRRWSIEPLPTNPNNTIVIQVLVTRVRDRGASDEGRVARLPDEARLATVKTRKAQ